jgi:hypothetical protein
MLPEPRKDWEPQEPWWHRPARIASALALVVLGAVITISASVILPQTLATLPMAAGLALAAVSFFVALGAVFFHRQ